ncbi:MAG TPA: GntR family transcriptional regulator [Pirellulales bacterium]|nr:GntR family transcriptional regulator [Pirellulales bacterium]
MTSAASRLNCDHGLRRQAIVESVLREVFQGRLRAGQHLATQQLADQFGVSHTPIREALISLAGIGVIDLVPNRGAIVRRVVAKDVREIFQVRRALECEAVRSACGRVDVAAFELLAEDLTRLKPAQARSSHRKPNDRLLMRSVEKARQIDSRLHDLICSSCGNGFLAKEITRLKTLFRAFRDLAWEHDTSQNDFRRVAEETGEHLAIVEALLAGDRRRAVRAMSYHIRSGARYWTRVLPEEAPGTNGSAPNRGAGRNGRDERKSRVCVEGNE